MLRLTVLSVLAVWALLLVLVRGLYAILKALEGVRRSMEKIAMGVRAIEQETAPLAGHAANVSASLVEAGTAAGAVAHGLEAVDSDLGPAAAALLSSR